MNTYINICKYGSCSLSVILIYSKRNYRTSWVLNKKMYGIACFWPFVWFNFFRIVCIINRFLLQLHYLTFLFVKTWDVKYDTSQWIRIGSPISSKPDWTVEQPCCRSPEWMLKFYFDTMSWMQKIQEFVLFHNGD